MKYVLCIPIANLAIRRIWQTNILRIDWKFKKKYSVNKELWNLWFFSVSLRYNIHCHSRFWIVKTIRFLYLNYYMFCIMTNNNFQHFQTQIIIRYYTLYKLYLRLHVLTNSFYFYRWKCIVFKTFLKKSTNFHVYVSNFYMTKYFYSRFIVDYIPTQTH